MCGHGPGSGEGGWTLPLRSYTACAASLSHLASGGRCLALSVGPLLQQWWRDEALGHSRRAEEERCAQNWLDSEPSIPAVLTHFWPVSFEQQWLHDAHLARSAWLAAVLQHHLAVSNCADCWRDVCWKLTAELQELHCSLASCNLLMPSCARLLDTHAHGQQCQAPSLLWCRAELLWEGMQRQSCLEGLVGAGVVPICSSR